MDARLLAPACFILFIFALAIHSTSAQTCTDTDSGINHSVKGRVSLGNPYNDSSECLYDVCMGDILSETYCNATGGMDWTEIDCLQLGMTCVNGRCAMPGEIPCNDTDGGRDYFSKGEVRFGNFSLTDFCAGSVLHESLCNELGSMEWDIVDCGLTGMQCGDGMCIDPGRGLACHDSDGGLEFGTAGTARIGTFAVEDYCLGNILTESFCNDAGNVDWIEHECPEQCNDGACHNIIHETNKQIVLNETKKIVLNETIYSDGISSRGQGFQFGSGVVVFVQTDTDIERPVWMNSKYMKGLPAGLRSHPDAPEVFGTFIFEPSEGLHDRIEEARAIIPVQKSWIESLGMGQNDVRLFRMAEGGWEELDFEPAGNDDIKAYYSVPLHFSIEIVYVGGEDKKVNIDEVWPFITLLVVIVGIWLVLSLMHRRKSRAEF